MPAVAVYLLFINVVAFIAFGLDKWKARHRRWRTREATLLLLAAVGGSVGAWLGMRLFHHKTLHKKFRYGIPFLFVLQITLVLLLSCRTHPIKNDAHPISADSGAASFSPTTIIVLYDPEVGKAPLLKAIKEWEAEIIYDYKMLHGMALRKPARRTLDETIAFFQKVPGVLSVERDHIIHLTDPVRPRLEVQ